MKKAKLFKSIALCLLSLAMLFSVTACSSTKKSSTEATDGTTLSGSTTESALLTAIKKKGYILIGSSNDAPFSYKNVETGKLEGVDIDILREICTRLGIPDIQMKVIDFSSLLVELNNSSIDMVVDAMYVKPDRLQIAAFSNKWYKEGEAVVIPANSAITSKDDLKGKSLGAQPGTTFFETAEKWKKDGKIGKLVSYDNQATLMTAVNTGLVDAVITDGIVAGYTLSQDSSLKLKLLTPYEAEASGQIGSAVRFTDKAFIEEVNKTLDAMKEDGTLMKILKNYSLSEDYFVSVADGKTVNVK
ncbi:MAG: amino acid ABC transporter substrate-binding protein [Clostridiales bacterium 43-6]|nr:MAG: amino acid ABC transporter substrate-binding protein [Clostridiales bacterium 43-6]